MINKTWSRTFLGVSSYFFVLLCGSFAYGDICSAPWWQANPPGFAVEAELSRGGDATSRCRNGDYPIHLAVLYGNADAVRALMNAGGNAFVQNSARNTAVELFEGRYENFVDRFGRATPDLDEIARLIGAQTGALNAGQNLLCDVSFWRNPSEGAVLNALNSGANPNDVCDDLGNRPVHIALNLQVMPLLLPRNHSSAIMALIEESDVNLRNPNTRGDTAVSLVQLRYDATLTWWEDVLHRAFATRDNRLKDEVMEREESKKGNEIALYRFTRAHASVELYNDVRARTNRAIMEAIDRIALEHGFTRVSPC